MSNAIAHKWSGMERRESRRDSTIQFPLNWKVITTVIISFGTLASVIGGGFYFQTAAFREAARDVAIQELRDSGIEDILKMHAETLQRIGETDARQTAILERIERYIDRQERRP